VPSTAEYTEEFGFTSDLPVKKSKTGLIAQIKSFWTETKGGAIPVALASKILKCSDVTIYRYIKSGKLHGYKFNKTVLVSINDVERMLDEPRNKGGRPVTKNT
jgi:hypothetical protein